MDPISPHDADLSQVLSYWSQQCSIALEQINTGATNPITDLELQVAVATSFGLQEEESTLIVYKRLTAEELIEYFKKSNFEKPQELALVVMDDSILLDNVPRRLDEQKVKAGGEIWRIHKYDKDHCPSNPHAHNLETGYKLHLGTGELFTKKCQPLYKKISRANLIALRGRIHGITLPPLQT